MTASASNRFASSPGRLRPFGVVLALLAVGPALPAAEPPAGGPLFPVAVRVEHRVVESGPDGIELATDPVVDHYVGRWIVSSRPNGSRLIVDLERREMTEIDATRGTVSVVSWERFAELRRRLAAAERAPAPAPGASMPRAAAPRIVEVTSKGENPALPPGIEAVASGAPVRHFRVDGGGDAPRLEAWLDPSVRFGPAARRALAAFEREALSAPGGDAGAAGALAAIREAGDGALVVRSRRPRAAGESRHFVEDLVTRVESPAAVPPDLLEIPDGFRRVAHPLEALVAAMEEEAALAALARGGAR